MATNINNPGTLLTALDDMHSGLMSDLPAGLTQLAVAGKVTSVADLQTEVQGYATVYQTAADAETAHIKAVQARDAVAPTVLIRYEAIRATVKAALGKTSPDLPKFGLTPQKPRAPLTVAQLQARDAKAKATRLARGTMGKKQKAAIKGQVPSPNAQAAAPTPAPTAPSASPAPAPAPKPGA